MLEWGLDEDFNLVYIKSADSSAHKYFCPECRALLIVKNRDFKDRERLRLKHFAHFTKAFCPASSSNSETMAHINTKLLMYDRLTQNKSCMAYLKVRVGETKQHIEFNLLEGVDRVELEKMTVGNLIPDISLYVKGKLARVIEIVATHEDSDSKTECYATNEIMAFRLITNEQIYHRLKRGALPIFTIGKQQLSKILS